MSDPDDIDRRLSLAKVGLSSSSSTRERVLAELTRRFPELAQAVPTTPQAPASPLPPAASPYAPRRDGGFWQALRMTGVRGAGLGVLLVGSGFMAGYAVRDSNLPASSLAPSLGDRAAFAPQPAAFALPELPRQAVARDSSRETTSPLDAPAAAAEPRARTASPPRRSLQAVATERPKLDLERELAVLRRAERAVRKGNPALALALLDDLESENPSSTLREERTATRLLASCQSLAPGAELAAQRFLEQHPGSVYAARLESSCRAPSSPSAGEPFAPATDAAQDSARSDGSGLDGH